jgi:hypothetical protein
MAGSYRRAAPPELLLALLAAVAVSIWRQRRSQTRVLKWEADIAKRVHRHEIPKVAAPMKLANQRFTFASVDFLKTLGLFALNLGLAVLFLAGFPFHAYWHPWGPITMTAGFFFLVLVVLIDGVGWMAELTLWRYQKRAHDLTYKRFET